LPTCHKKFGEATAILAGDGLLTLAFQVLASGYPPATACGCCVELARGAGDCGMVAGQALDLAWEAGATTALPRNLQSLERIHSQKTGALFRACLRMGAWVAQGERAGGPEPGLLEAVDTFGRCLGMVFQITDDLLDVEGNEAVTGKRVGKDAARGKLTYPGLLGLEESRRRARAFRDRACMAISALPAGGDELIRIVNMLLERSS
jgi:geranylgeranyl diphosphate synthase type II